MKAIILAAGEGTRLRPLTKDVPKCLVKLFEKSLLEWQIDVFRQCKISDISVVVGYKKEKMNLANLKFYFNDKFNSTNMVETLFCAKKEFDDTIIISYGDIIFEKSVLQKLISSNEAFSIIIDKEWEKYWKIRFENPLDDAESLKIDELGNISDIGQKTDKIKDIEGQFIGLIKIQGEGLEMLKSFYRKTKEIAYRTGKNPLNSNLPFEKSYLTDLLQGLIKEKVKLKPIFVNNGWLELDSINDYEIYNQMYEENSISNLIKLEEK